MSVLLRGNLPKINIICDFRQEIEECFCLDGIMFKGDFCQNEIGDIIRKTSEKDNTLCEKNIDKNVLIITKEPNISSGSAWDQMWDSFRKRGCTDTIIEHRFNKRIAI